MKKHSNTYEQYCCVRGKNVIMEELVYHNGKKVLRCTNAAICQEMGGCQNHIIKQAITETSRTKLLKNIGV